MNTPIMKKNYKLVIEQKNLAWYLLFLIMCMIYLLPPYFKTFAKIYKFYYEVLPYVSMFFLILLTRRGKHKLFLFFVFIFYAILIFTTKTNGGNYYYLIQLGCIAFGFSSLLLYVLQRKDCKSFVYILLFVFEFYIIINFISVLLFPQGLYVIYGYDENYFNPAYIFGHRNNAIEYFIPAIGICAIVDNINKKWLSLNTSIIIGISLITTILTWSVNSVLCVVFIILCYTCVNLYKKFKYFNVLFAFIVSASISYGIIVFQIQIKFKDFIENVLHKDVTLTSRSIVWERALKCIGEKPILGYGLEDSNITFSRIGHLSSCHNYFLDYLYLGGICLLLVVCAMVLYAHSVFKKLDKQTIIQITISYGAYFILWIATPIHKDSIFIMFIYMLSSICIQHSMKKDNT